LRPSIDDAATFDAVKPEFEIRVLRRPIRGIIRRPDWLRRLSIDGAAHFMTARIKAAAKPTSSLTQPAGIDDMLDYQLYLLYRDCGYVFERLCQFEFGVSRRRWRILATLSAAEGITVSDLSKRAELDIAQTSRAIGTLAREGYLKRLANPRNARFAQVILTDKGRNLYHSMFVRFREVNNQLLRDMSEEEVQNLCNAISTLRHAATRLNASRSNGAPPALAMILGAPNGD
jgi:DNA-binding MarR family transcriptional regulator